MNKEEIKKRLVQEGYKRVFEWSDEPNYTYSEHEHSFETLLVITKGSIWFEIGGREYNLKEGDELLVSPQTKHKAKVGPEGCWYIVGEEK